MRASHAMFAICAAGAACSSRHAVNGGIMSRTSLRPSPNPAPITRAVGLIDATKSTLRLHAGRPQGAAPDMGAGEIK
jgi:hypothetical protein